MSASATRRFEPICRFAKRVASAPALVWLVVACAALGTAVGLAYAAAFSNGFLYDDRILILNNNLLNDWRQAADAFLSDLAAGGGIASPFYRPLQTLLYLVLKQTFGLSPTAFHAANIAFHAANACLVFTLGKRLGFAAKPSFAAALFWAVHPAHVEAVAYASATADVLHTFFCLCGLILLAPGPTRGRLWAATGLYALALLSKEAAAIFPLLAAATLFLKDAPIKTYARLWPLAAIAAAYVGLRQTNPAFADFTLYNAPSPCADAALCRVSTFLATLPAYGKIILWPFGLHGDRSFPTFAVPWQAQPLTGLALLAAAAFTVFKARTAPRAKPLAWAAVWFFAADLPHSGLFIAVNGALMEHWLYLATIGPALAAAQAISNLIPARRRLAAVGAGCALALTLGGATYAQTLTWRDAMTFFSRVVSFPDHLPRAHIGLANAYLEKGDTTAAQAQLEQAIALSNDASPEARYIYGAILYRQAQTGDDVRAAIIHFERALAILPVSYPAAQALANAYAEIGDLERAQAMQSRADSIAAHLRKTHMPKTSPR